MSASFNKIMLMGNLTSDPRIKQLPSNTTVVEFGLAVSRKFKTQAGEDREEVAFVDCAAFGKQAETISQFCTKGKPLFVEGRVKYDTWDDKHGGGKRSKLSVVVESFQFLPSARAGGTDPDGVNQGEAPFGEDQRPSGEMFGGGAERKGWRGQQHRTGLPDTKPQARRNPRADQAARAAANDPPPYSDEQQFKDADIPF